MTKFFADSNVILYSIGPDPAKASRANALILRGLVISVQVLNEFMRVATRKFRMDVPDALIAIAPAKIACEIVPLTLETHELAVALMREHKLQIYDANIVAAAELAGCDVLYTEDLSHGQRIGRVLIQNPFVTA